MFLGKYSIYNWFFGSVRKMFECFFASTNENLSDRMNENHPVRFEITMAGIPGKGGVKGRSGPPGNMNAFKHGLAAVQKRREESITTMRRGKSM
jgi:hypothetical protein